MATRIFGSQLLQSRLSAMDIEESKGCASRGRAQRLIKMPMKRLANDTRIVTHFTVQQSFPNEHVDFRFA
jgi:hypothetical protein